MNGGPTPEEKRRIVRLVLLLAILIGTIYALMNLADRLQEAQDGQVEATGPETSAAETVD